MTALWHIADDVLIGSKVRYSRGTSPQLSDRLLRILLIAGHPAKVPLPNPQPPHALGSGDRAIIATGDG